MEEAKQSIIRDHKRDTRTLMSDSRRFEELVRQKRIDNQTPTL
jgi:hypothetical protein